MAPPAGEDGLPRAAGRFMPHPSSLDFAAELAARAGLDFERAETEALAERLYETCYEALIDALDLTGSAPPFHAEVYWLTNAFAAVPVGADDAPGGPRVVFDENFDLWLFALSHYSVIAALKDIDDAAFFALLPKVRTALRYFNSARLRQRVLDELESDLRTHADALNLSGGLARALMVFTFCHEIAHCRLGHPGRPPDPEDEIAADREAAALFLRLIEKGPALRESPVYVDPKLTGAPLILPRWLALYEQRMQVLTGRPPRRDTHPEPEARFQATAAVLVPYLSEQAAMLVRALDSAVDDFARAMAAGH